MRILYYYWGENSKEDCVDALLRLGHEVQVWTLPMENYTSDPIFSEKAEQMVSVFVKQGGGSACLFSFDYFPLLSEVALASGLPYISWVYDSPHYTLESLTLGNPCNYVYIFDRSLEKHYRELGVSAVHHMPLPVNVNRIDRLLKEKNRGKLRYEHEICFLGSLYNDEYDFYEQIGYLPEDLKTYLDDVIRVQGELIGKDVVSELLPAKMCDVLEKYVKADLGPEFRNARDTIFQNMLRKKVTVNERQSLLMILGQRFSTDLYSGKEPPADLPVRYCGTADYHNEMPVVFSRSKINLNITLRSILTGIPLRVVDILGAGGFCLTNYQEELSEYFSDGKELAWFESKQEMLEKAEYFLAHDRERECAAAAGRNAAERFFSYDVLLPKVFSNLC
ncbi:MAG: DUF3880 domain-containing protein [Lachnospiraceae bacterium]|nr:DUF3880 domain-containing protein [Lachnospiraceae bacterium]